MIIRCLSCGTKNRMPEERIHNRPLCGKCREPLVVSSSSDQPVEISDASFADEVISSAIPVLVDCWAPWCGPCKTVAPILNELSSKYAGGVKIAKINIDENPLIASPTGKR